MNGDESIPSLLFWLLVERVGKVAYWETLGLCLDRTAVCVFECETGMWFGATDQWWSYKYISLSGEPHASKRGGEKKRRGDGRGRQCGFEMRLFLYNLHPHPRKHDVSKVWEKNSSWFGYFFPRFSNAIEQNSLRFGWTDADMKFPIENPRKQVNWDPEQGW